MGIFDRFKSKKKAPSNGVELPSNGAKQEKSAPQPAPKAEAPVKTATRGLSDVLVRPMLSEKGTHLASTGKYVFEVSPRANKTEIKKSVQAVYSVHVMAVKILKMPSKTRRYGRIIGKTSPFKKAIVSLRPGEKIPGIIESVG